MLMSFQEFSEKVFGYGVEQVVRLEKEIKELFGVQRFGVRDVLRILGFLED